MSKDTKDVKGLDFTAVDEKLKWNTLFTEFAAVTKNKDSPISWIQFVLEEIKRNNNDKCYQWYIDKLLKELNKTLDKCIVSSIDSKLKPTEKTQLFNILNNKYTRGYNTTINNFIEVIASQIVGFFECPGFNQNTFERSRAVSLIDLIDNPKLLTEVWGSQTVNNDIKQLLDTHNITDALKVIIENIAKLPRDIQAIISTNVVKLQIAGYNFNYSDTLYLDNITKLQHVFDVYQPLTWSNISKLDNSLNIIRTSLNILEHRLGDTVISLIEQCVIDNFLNKLFDDETAIVTKEFKGVIERIKKDPKMLE